MRLTRTDGRINETSRLLLLYTFSVSTVIRLRDGWQRKNISIAGRRKIFFLPTKCPDPSSLLRNEHRGKYPGNKFEHPPLTSTKDKNTRSYTWNSPYPFISYCVNELCLYLFFPCLACICAMVPLWLVIFDGNSLFFTCSVTVSFLDAKTVLDNLFY